MKYLLDTHCHLYTVFSPERWASSAFTNFSSAKKLIATDEISYGIILTERITENYFKAWQEKSPFRGDSAFKLSPRGETTLCIEEISTGICIDLYPGRQFKTAESLEVLSISGRVDAPDGLSVAETISEITRQDHVPVLPWSFGKWMGARRKIIFKVLEQASDVLYIGDIVHRPALEPLEKIAARFNKKILAGTDPLPIASDTAKVARKTSLVTLPNSICKPESIIQILSRGIIETVNNIPSSLPSIIIEQVVYMFHQKFRKIG